MNRAALSTGVEAAERVFRANDFAAFGGQRGSHRRFEETGQDHVAADVARPYSRARLLRESDQARLGRSVGALTTRAATGRPRPNQNDVAAALLDHQFHAGLRTKKGAA